MLNIVICDDDIDFREIVEYKVRACLAGFLTRTIIYKKQSA